MKKEAFYRAMLFALAERFGNRPVPLLHPPYCAAFDEAAKTAEQQGWLDKGEDLGAEEMIYLGLRDFILGLLSPMNNVGYFLVNPSVATRFLESHYAGRTSEIRAAAEAMALRLEEAKAYREVP